MRPGQSFLGGGLQGTQGLVRGSWGGGCCQIPSMWGFRKHPVGALHLGFQVVGRGRLWCWFESSQGGHSGSLSTLWETVKDREAWRVLQSLGSQIQTQLSD